MSVKAKSKSFKFKSLSGLTGALILAFLSACSAHEKSKTFLFYGECQVEVQSETGGAEILLDGIHVGENHIKTDMPCGEKHIQIVKQGFFPYDEYLPSVRGQALKVTAKLEPFKSLPNVALSSEVLEKAKLSVASSSTPGASKSSGAPAGAATNEDLNNVESWR